MELDDNGYTTGYQLLHGTTKYNNIKTDHKQQLEINYELKRNTSSDKIIIIGRVLCIWHDIIDANKKYFGEHELAELIKKFSNAKDYKIHIPFYFSFQWKLKSNKQWEKTGYPWQEI